MQGHYPFPFQVANTTFLRHQLFYTLSMIFSWGEGGVLYPPPPGGGGRLQSLYFYCQEISFNFFSVQFVQSVKRFPPTFFCSIFFLFCFLFLVFHFKSPSNFPVQSFLLLSFFSFFLHLRALVLLTSSCRAGRVEIRRFVVRRV